MSSASNNIMGNQVRAARALLHWNANDLAERSGVSLATIRRAEAVDGEPQTTAGNLKLLRMALEAAGVEFIPENGGGPGVRLREPTKAAPSAG